MTDTQITDDQTQDTNIDETIDETQTASETTDVQTMDELRDDPAVQLLELEKSIKTFHSGIAMKREEMKKIREMIKDTLENDEGYAVTAEKVQAVKQEQKKVQDQLMAVGSVISAKEDLKELRDDLNELQALFSKNLMKYYQLSNLSSITMEDGQIYAIQTSAKLVRQRTVSEE